MSDDSQPTEQPDAKRQARPKKQTTTGPVPFGPYRLLNLLGQGGMGRVYRAIRYGTEGGEEELALKILDRRATSTSAQVRALVDEVRLGQLLRHSNIVRTDELRKVGDSYCIAMEYVDGWPLDRMIELHRTQGQPIPLVTALELMVAIADGLTYAHALSDENGQHLGLVHRDLKPGNVMIARNGSVKLMDFGTAKSAANLYQTEDGETRGTPLYMSPEQVMGNDIDQRSDIFSLGSILYELVMLEPCFKGSNLVMVMRNVADADLEEQREDIAAAAAALEPIFSRCMQAKPEDRFQTVPDLADKLRELHQNRPVGPSVQGWLDTLSGITPDSTTGDFGAVAIPGMADELPTGNIQTLDTQELKTARLAQAASEDIALDKTLDPESARTQVLAARGKQKPRFQAPNANASPLPPETADILATDEFEPLEEERKYSLPGDDFPPNTPLDKSPSSPQPAKARPKPTSRPARKRAGAVQPLKVKGKGSAWFWLKQLIPLGIVVGLSIALFQMLPTQTKDNISTAIEPLLSRVLPAQVRGSRASGKELPAANQAKFSSTTVHIDAAELVLGSPDEPTASPSTKPIPVPPFNIMAYEVTVGDFTSWCQSKTGKEHCAGWQRAEAWQNSEHPVVNVSWHEASAYCENWGGRLPTESEWELAARGSERRTYPWGSEWATGRANYCDLGCESPYLPTTYEDDGTPQTAVVDSFAQGATAQGVYHLAGNVSEWTMDCWTTGHARRMDWRAGSAACQLRVKRGGSWKQPVPTLTGWYRSSMRSEARSNQVGFRCLRGRDPS
jgi:serine/threonine protein kinase